MIFCNFDPDGLLPLDTSDKEEPCHPADPASCPYLDILLLCPGILHFEQFRILISTFLPFSELPGVGWAIF